MSHAQIVTSSFALTVTLLTLRSVGLVRTDCIVTVVTPTMTTILLSSMTVRRHPLSQPYCPGMGVRIAPQTVRRSTDEDACSTPLFFGVPGLGIRYYPLALDQGSFLFHACTPGGVFLCRRL